MAQVDDENLKIVQVKSLLLDFYPLGCINRLSVNKLKLWLETMILYDDYCELGGYRKGIQIISLGKSKCTDGYSKCKWNGYRYSSLLWAIIDYRLFATNISPLTLFYVLLNIFSLPVLWHVFSFSMVENELMFRALSCLVCNYQTYCPINRACKGLVL